MKLSNVNEWLTLTANIGVLAGIIFLAVEIQQNTALSRASAYRDTIQEISDWRENLMADPSLRNCFSQYQQNGYDSIDNTECGGVFYLINNIIGTYETAFFDRQYGFIGEAEWSRLSSSACRHYLTAKEHGPNLNFITDDFREFLETNC